MIKNLRYISALDRRGMKKAVALEILHSLFVAAPTGILLIIIWELFSEHPDINKVWRIVLVMLFMLVTQFFVATKTMVTTNLWVYGLANRLRMELGNRIQKFSLGFFKQRDPGEIAGVVLQDVANFEGIFGHSVGNIASAIFGTLVLSSFLVVYDWRLALSLLAAIPLIFPFLQLANYFVSRLGSKQIAARNTAGAKFLEYVQGIRHLKSYGLTGSKHERLEAAFDDLRKKSIKMEAIPGPFIVAVGVIFEVFFILMVSLGLYYLINNSLSVPVFITFLIMGYHLYGPLKVVLVDYLVLSYMNESLKRIVTVLHTPTMEADKELIPSAYHIKFENVFFGYQKDMVLHDLSFDIPEHTMLALVGHSGSGKTTIASLIARFWDVQSGAVSIGGIDIRHIKQEYFYGLISEVFQDVYLFDETIYENIRIGRPDATHDEILNAAEKAQVLSFTSELPMGMDTRVGEGGSKLSGGQKQRISIARALLKDAPIVLLDEATASLDPENEIYIQYAIQQLVKSKTVVVIAHKLATIQQANQILVLDQGVIAERGSHTQLLENEGVYHRMWNIQLQSSGWKI